MAATSRYLAKELGMPSHISLRLGSGERAMRIGTFPVGIETRQLEPIVSAMLLAIDQGRGLLKQRTNPRPHAIAPDLQFERRHAEPCAGPRELLRAWFIPQRAGPGNGSGGVYRTLIRTRWRADILLQLSHRERKSQAVVLGVPRQGPVRPLASA